MELTCIPDLGVIMPPDDMPHATLRERVAAACKTIEELAQHGLPQEALQLEETDAITAADVLTAYAKDEETTNKRATTANLATLKPAVILQIDSLLTEFSHSVIKNAVQIRNFVTNKLILEADNPDPKVRIRALELLGKVSDVGLFTERSEVTVTHRSTEDLRKSLREKLEILRSKSNFTDVVDVSAVPREQVSLTANLDAELGFDPMTAPDPDSLQHKNAAAGYDDQAQEFIQ